MKPSRTCQISCCKIPPLKIRGVEGSYEVMEITPLCPPYSKGEIEEGNPYSKGDVE